MDCGVFTMNRNHLKRVIRKWRKGSMGYEELSPTYSTASCATPGMNRPNGHPGRCEGKQNSFSKRLIRKNEVTVVVGKERQVFKVDPHILQDRLFQSLLQSPTTRCVNWDQSHTDENRFRDALQTSDKCSADNSGDGVNYSAGGCIVFLDCDAILFEHMLWLVYNDDPSVPHLNLEELMEFYAQEGV